MAAEPGTRRTTAWQEQRPTLSVVRVNDNVAYVTRVRVCFACMLLLHVCVSALIGTVCCTVHACTLCAHLAPSLHLGLLTLRGLIGDSTYPKRKTREFATLRTVRRDAHGPWYDARPSAAPKHWRPGAGTLLVLPRVRWSSPAAS